MPEREALFDAAKRLHAYLLRRHFSGGVLHGPDSGIRFNLRAWRFLKSALDFVPWHDDYTFMQSQGYWILSNWMLHETTAEPHYRDVARGATEAALKLQQPSGAWAYPLPERKHLIATIEGNWGAIGLLATHAREPRAELVAGAIRWYEFLVSRIGFQAHSRGKAINYFQIPRGKIPNNSVEAAWVFGRLSTSTGEARFLEHLDGLLDFVAAVQVPTGELPYVVESPYERERLHYLCFQYNAFQFLKLAWLAPILRMRGDVEGAARVEAIARGLARFLENGVTASGACAADCSRAGRGGPELDYYTAVLGAALLEASRVAAAETSGLSDLSDRCYARVLARQNPDGSFDYSRGDYGFLNDRRSYPRQQVMTLFHLLYGCGIGDGFPKQPGA